MDLFKEQTALDFLKREKLPGSFHIKVDGNIQNLSKLFFDRSGEGMYAITDANANWVRENTPESIVRDMLQDVARGDGPRLQASLTLGGIFS